MKLASRFILGLTIGLIAGAFVSAAGADAQYAPVRGSLQCVSGSSTTSGGSAQVTVTILDTAGKPMSGQQVIFNIASSSSSTARLGTGATFTDSSGRANVALTFGSNPGNVSVIASSESLQCQASFTPPAAQVLGSVFTPPTTGDGGLLQSASGSEGGASGDFLALIAAGLLLAVLGSSIRLAAKSRAALR